MTAERETPLTDAFTLSLPQEHRRTAAWWQINFNKAVDHSRRLERDRARLMEVMRQIAKPALGGKQQQYMAQQILREMEER